MGILADMLVSLSGEATRNYNHWYVGERSGPVPTDTGYARVWLRSARITDVRRWTRKFYPTVHARFVHADPSVGLREVMSVSSPNKTFQELDSRHLDRFIVVNQSLLGPIPFRGELTSEIALFSVVGDDLAKPYLDLLSEMSASAIGSSFPAVEPLIAPLKRGAEMLLLDQSRAELEIGLARTDTEFSPGNIVVGRTEMGGPAIKDLKLDPDDFRLLDAKGKPVDSFPYMVIGMAFDSERADFRTLPDLRAAWKGVSDAAQKGEPQETVIDAFRALMRVVNFSADLIRTDRRRIVGIFAEELRQAGYSLDGVAGLPPPPTVGGAGAATEIVSVPRPLPVTESIEVAEAWKAETGRISISEARRMIIDPQVPEHVVRQILIPDQQASRPFAPALRFNPDVVAVGTTEFGTEGAQMMSWANELAAWRRKNAFLARIEAKDPRPLLVSVGDSWFQFPIFLDDVIDQLGSAYSIWSLDVAGDTLENMILRQKRHIAGLKQWKGKAKALLVSGSGNDIVGEDPDGVSVLTKILKPFCRGKPPEWYIKTGEFERRIGALEACFSSLFAEVAEEFPDLPVICHGYDLAIPSYPGDPRHPLWASQDAWLAGPMSNRLGIRDPKLQRAIIAALINELNAMQIRLCGGNGRGRHANAWHVDVRGKVGTRWADELHPTDDGFSTVGKLFKTVLDAALSRTEAQAIIFAAAEGGTEAYATQGRDAELESSERIEARLEVLRTEGASPENATEGEAGPMPPVSARALNLIVEYETGGRLYYDRVIRRLPIWPKGASGVTIGFGYDLGYIKPAEFERDWAALPAAIRSRLAKALGRHGGRDSDAELKALVAALKDIEIPWEMAEAVFTAATVPKFVRATVRVLDNTQTLSPDCFGSLVSLSFNRGAAYRKLRSPSDPLDRYREMRGIGAAMTERRFGDIPGLMRLMKRVWRGTAVEAGLARRREDEAVLFEAGLAAMPGFVAGT
ncbi:hypothetical protein [Neorhizobium huautlense]|uniref:hypothetical protein n=1 Tax=Neorhizobium huautlense TaxID=67774 RepID=UPI000CF8CA13|nr:hypothetical protein [Neorhizobium huautlense]